MPSPTTPTPAIVAQQATQADALPLNGMTLLGTRVNNSGASALVRDGRGGVSRVTPGDKLDGYVVAAIGNGQIHLARGSEAQVLAIAGS
ncbi:pilus assembly protein PilP [Pseudooceanicola sp. CBS1P-1]|uniref:Pilus assembly protein PilZ n=1 Tax=Pseudooceanicola albus TaxID=2692189 RepID=A0A6L7G0L4_9RHOB|nr:MULTISPECIES: pilus assembly protein PilP [Pseudooceanicola]MBT9382497.1 pilus assembly protein PilP [Pseudooceanicola endophyticus]MXN17038.1 pilus assembly protein PilZ [Pseudooceanicola albus]